MVVLYVDSLLLGSCAYDLCFRPGAHPNTTNWISKELSYVVFVCPADCQGWCCSTPHSSSLKIICIVSLTILCLIQGFDLFFRGTIHMFVKEYVGLTLEFGSIIWKLCWLGKNMGFWVEKWWTWHIIDWSANSVGFEAGSYYQNVLTIDQWWAHIWTLHSTATQNTVVCSPFFRSSQ